MPTAKPRITVTLQPRTYEVLGRLSKASGESMSAICTSLVDAALPSFTRLAAVLERATKASEEVRAGVAAAVERAERDLLPQLLEAQRMGDLFLADVEEALPTTGTAAQRRRQAAAVPPDPRLVTRGSGAPKTGRKGVKRG